MPMLCYLPKMYFGIFNLPCQCFVISYKYISVFTLADSDICRYKYLKIKMKYIHSQFFTLTKNFDIKASCQTTRFIDAIIFQDIVAKLNNAIREQKQSMINQYPQNIDENSGKKDFNYD